MELSTRITFINYNFVIGAVHKWCLVILRNFGPSIGFDSMSLMISTLWYCILYRRLSDDRYGKFHYCKNCDIRFLTRPLQWQIFSTLTSSEISKFWTWKMVEIRLNSNLEDISLLIGNVGVPKYSILTKLYHLAFGINSVTVKNLNISAQKNENWLCWLRTVTYFYTMLTTFVLHSISSNIAIGIILLYLIIYEI